jgi:hypothetical protein
MSTMAPFLMAVPTCNGAVVVMRSFRGGEKRAKNRSPEPTQGIHVEAGQTLAYYEPQSDDTQ